MTEKILAASNDKRLINFFVDLLLVGFFAYLWGTFTHLSLLYYFLPIYFLYFILFEGKYSKSPAKFLTKTKVVTRDGKQPLLTAIFVRTLLRLIPVDIFSFSGFNPVGWHDSLSGTMVVDNEMKYEKVPTKTVVIEKEVTTQPTVASTPDSATAPTAIKKKTFTWPSAAQFYWIGGLSWVNTFLALMNMPVRFLVSLAITEVFIGLNKPFAVVINLVVFLLFIGIGKMANKGKKWAYTLGTVLYALDGFIYLLVGDWLSVAFHIYILYRIFTGMKLHLRAIEQKK